MVKSESALLALIHQHLLKNGYSGAARQLEIENGENFATSKITLRHIYKLWTKKSKEKIKKTEDAKRKKWDHDSKKAEHLDLALQAKKAKQVKKKMNLATEVAADVKVNSKKTLKKASSSLNDYQGSSVTQAADVFPDGNDSSDSKGKTASANAAPIQAAILKSKPGAEKSDESSSSSESEEEATKQVIHGKKIPDTAATKQKSLSKPSNGKAQESESSDDSDETDIDKPPAPVTSNPTVPSTGLQSSKGKRQAAPPVQKVQAESSTENSETDEEELVRQVVTPTPELASPPAVSTAKFKGQTLLSVLQSIKAESSESDSEEEPVKQGKTPSKAAKAVKASPTKPTKGRGKATTPAQTNASAVKSQLHSQKLVSETESDSSDSEEQKTPFEITSKTAAATPLTPLVVAKLGMPIKTELSSDEEESSDSDEEPTTKKAATTLPSQTSTASAGTKQTPIVPSNFKKTALKTPQPADESSEDESDSEEEPAVKKPGAVLQSSRSKTPMVEAKSNSPSKPPQPASESSEEESDSDEEHVAKKPATVLRLSQPKTPSGGAKQARVLAKTQSPAKTTRQADESSEEESDSDEESAAKKPTTAVQSSQPKTPSRGAKQTTLKATLKTPLKTAQLDSESSEESDTDEETVAKKSATALQSTQSKSPRGNPKQTAMIAKSKTSQLNSESSEEESDSDEEAAAKTTPAVQVKMSAPASSFLTVKQSPAVQVPDSDADSESSESSDTEHKQPKPSAVSREVKGKQTVSNALKSDESSEESESESEEEPVKLAEIKTLEKQKAKLSSSQHKTTAQPATSKGKSLVTSKVTTVSQAVADSSESTESSDNEDLAPAQVPRTSVKATPPAAISTVQPAAVAKHKAGGPAKSVPRTTLAAVDQGTSDSSESSDSEEEQPGAQKLSVEAKQKKKPMSAPLLTSTPYESTASKGKSVVPASTPPVAKAVAADISESSDTESDEEETAQVVTPTSSFVKSKSGGITDQLSKTSTSSNAAVAKPTTPFKVPPTLKDRGESSSESSDSESSEEMAVKVNTPVSTAVKAAQAKDSGKLKTPNVTSPMPGKTNSGSQQKPKQVDADSSSESSDSEEEPVVKKVTAPGPTAIKMKQGNQSDKVVKTPLTLKPLPGKLTGTSVAKTPLQEDEESSSEASDSEEDTAEKLRTRTPPKVSEQSVKTPLPSTEVKGKATSLSRSPVIGKPATADTSSSSSESDEEPVIKPTPKPAAQPSVRKTTTQSPAVLQKKESSSEESDSDEEEPVKKPTPKPAAQPSVRKTTTQSPAVLQKKQESSSEESDSDEEEPVKKNKGAATGNLISSQKTVGRSVGKISSSDVKKIKSEVPSTPSGGSKPKDSQPLLKVISPMITTQKKRKRASKTTSILDLVAEKSKKKKTKSKVQPDTIPVPPFAPPEKSPSAVALLESEEETVLALLEGRSPKKAKKKKKISKKTAETAVFHFATPLVQNNDVPKNSPLPQPFLSSTWVPESPTSGDDKSVQPTTELPSLSDKKAKSSKKRKISQELEKQNQKPAKKAKQDKKEKKIQKSMVEEANVTATPLSEKKKSEKDRSKKTKTEEKKNKEGKKKEESMAAAVVESADSGISLSKPKKKRKT